MRISLIVIGRLKAGPETELFERYYDRVKKSGKQVGLDILKITEFPESKLPSAEARKDDEANKIINALSSNSTLICLDERGDIMTSENFSRKISRIRDQGCQEVTFVIGGPDGLSEELRKHSNHILAFGKMTYPHMLMRVLLMEQIYRAISIETGHPYHRE